MNRISVRLSLALLLVAVCAATAFAARTPATPFGTMPADALRAGPTTERMGPVLTTSGAYADIASAVLAAGLRLVDLQSDVTEDNAGNGDPDGDTNDGGWDWLVTGQAHHLDAVSYSNLYGPITRGLVEMAIATGNARMATALGDVFAGISKPGTAQYGVPYYRIYDGDIVYGLLKWARYTGNTVLRDSVRTRYDVVMAEYAAANPGMNGAAVRARIIRNGRVGQGLPGLWPWDVDLLANDSDALRNAFPGVGAYAADLDSISQVVMDDMNGLLGTPGNWSPTDFTQGYHQLGLAGALRLFDASPRTDDDALATAMRDSLVNAQLPDGSWGISYGGTFYGQDLQTTSYAALALAEYAKRHGDVTAMHAAFVGRQWLLGFVQAGGVVDDGNGEYTEGSAELAQALLSGDDISPVPPATCITPAHACVEVPVVFNRVDTTPVRGVSVTLTLSSNLALCGAGIVQGTYLGGMTNFHVLDLGGGVYTVDCATLGTPCGAIGSGTLFTLNLASSAGSGVGTVTINSVTARDCNNADVSAAPGAPALITIDNTAPVAIANLTAAQVKTGNDGDGTTKIALTFTAPSDAAKVHLYRAGWGNYPEYDDVGGGVPSYPGVGTWTLAATLTAPVTGYIDEVGWPARDFWYYVAVVEDACGNLSSASNQTAGTLNYHLGDVSNGGSPGVGNNRVFTEDMTLLGAHYGLTLVPGDPFNYLDVGPTTDRSVNARPTTDNKIEFEDLMVFAMIYNLVSAPQAGAVPVAMGTDEVWVDAPAQVVAGATFTARLRMRGAGDVQGLSAQLGWDRTVAEPVGYEAGGLIVGQDGVVLSSAPGSVDAAVLGSGKTIGGEGEVAVVTFRALRSGAPQVALASLEARDAANRSVTAAGVRPELPVATSLAPAAPNPFAGRTVLAYALAQDGPVELAIYSVDGRKVATLVHETKAAGEYRQTWEGAGMRPGLYYARLVTPQGRFTRTLVLMK